MPRKPRFILPGQPQHIIIRGVNREPIFYQNDDYRSFLTRLSEAIDKHGCALHAYVLMTNHVHLLLTPTAKWSIGKAIQMLGRYYVQYFNKTYGRTGTLWEGRYKSAMVDTEQYLLTCYRYIELNPVRAHMVAHPGEYPWSSYRYNGVGQSNSLISTHELYNGLAQADEGRKKAYRALFDMEIDDIQLNEIRASTNNEWILGSENFKASIEQILQRRTTPLPRGGDRKSKSYKIQCHGINRH